MLNLNFIFMNKGMPRQRYGWLCLDQKKIRVFSLSVLSLVLLLSLAGCGIGQKFSRSGTDPAHSEDWLGEEILKQLSELRKENIAIQAELKSINEKLPEREKERVKGEVPSAVLGISFDSRHALGDKRAPIAIIEYTDYECPFCARHVKNELPKILENLIKTGKVRYQLADYPLDFHSTAKQAAVAANCAGKHGVERFWAMHDALFENQSNLGEELYFRQADILGIDRKSFAECLHDPENDKAVERSIAYGNEIGVTGTPKFFIGRIEGNTITNVATISGARPYSVFQAAVNKLLN